MTHKSATRQFPTSGSALQMVGGRNRHNVRRQAAAEARRARLVKRLATVQFYKRGWQTRLAKQLGVHRSTICRDFRKIIREARELRDVRADQIASLRCEVADRLHECLADREDDL